MKRLSPQKRAAILHLIRQRQREIIHRQGYEVTKEELAEWLTLQAMRKSPWLA